VNGVIEQLNRLATGIVRRPGTPLQSLAELKTRFGIDYRAPADARASGLPSGSIDCVTSTYTLEHIPPEDLRRILSECHRIVKPGKTVLSLIDYQDHYSWRDSRISVYNFLQYSEREWSWFNSSLHYQNRLRHSHYRQMLLDAGFSIASEDLTQPSERDLQRFKSIRLSREFETLPESDLLVLGSRIVCLRSESN
jgi:SAM-dependent methyltransferase